MVAEEGLRQRRDPRVLIDRHLPTLEDENLMTRIQLSSAMAPAQRLSLRESGGTCRPSADPISV